MVCALNDGKFAVGVADAKLFDTSCGGEQLVLNAKTAINTSIEQAIQETTVYGGKGNRAQFVHKYQKELTVTLEEATFSAEFMAIQNGTNIVNKLTEFYKEESVTFDADGKAVLASTPNGNVQVLLNGVYSVYRADADNAIVVPELANQTTTAVYANLEELKTITIDGETFPQSLKLVLNIDIYDNVKKVEEMQIVIPKFSPDGNMTISLTSDGVATSSMTGKALDSCDGYATVSFKSMDDVEGACYVALVATPSEIELDSTAPEAVTLAVRGIRGGMYGNIPLDNTSLKFTSSDEAVATVDANGVVTLAATGVAGNTANITVSDEKETVKTIVVVEVI